MYASDHDEVLAQLTLMRERKEALVALVRQLAHTTPREGEWERTYRALQAHAREMLGSMPRKRDEPRVPAGSGVEIRATWRDRV